MIAFPLVGLWPAHSASGVCVSHTLRAGWFASLLIGCWSPLVVDGADADPLWQHRGAAPLTGREASETSPITGRLERDRLGGWHLLRPDGRGSHPIVGGDRLEKVTPPRVRPTAGMPLRIDLPGVTGWPVSWIAWRSGEIHMEPWRGREVVLDGRQVQRLRQPAGELTVQFHRGGKGAASPPGSLWAGRPAVAPEPGNRAGSDLRGGWPLRSGDEGVLLRSVSSAHNGAVSVAYRLLATSENEPSQPSDPAVFQLEFLFADQPPGAGLRVECGPTGPRASGAAAWRLQTAEAVTDLRGWQELELQFDAQRSLLLAGDVWIARGTAPPGGLREVRVQATSTESNAGSLVEFDSLRQTVALETLSAPEWPAISDTLWLDSGDELPLDEVLEMPVDPNQSAAQIRPNSDTPPWRDWSRLRGVIRARQPPGRWAEERGPLVRVTLGATQGLMRETGGVVEGRVTELAAGMLTLMHPQLGELQIPLTEMESLEFLGNRSRQRLEPAPHHLGNNLRPGWRIARPEGPTWSLSYERDADGPREARVELTMLVHELLPRDKIGRASAAASSGLPPAKPNSPVTGPRTGTVAIGAGEGDRGHPLETWVLLDDQPVGALNDLLLEDPLPGVRVPLRIVLPATALKAGRHVLRFIQIPASNDSGEFDDLEFEEISLEWPSP